MEGKEERKNKFNRETKEEVSREREREGEKGEDGTVAVKRKCINHVFAEAFDIFSQGEESESCENSWGDLWDDSSGLSDCGFVTLSNVPVVTDVLVSPSSALAVRSDALSDSGLGNCGTADLFFLQKASSRLCGGSRRHEL